MPHTLAYYVTGHGLGHARRSAEIIRALLAMRSDVRVLVRTAAPAFVFAELGERSQFSPVTIDRGAVELDPLRIDWQASLQVVEQLLAEKDSLVAAEAKVLRLNDVKLMVADIPFLPGYIAQETKIPCWGVSNFTWDWVYEPHAGRERSALVNAVSEGYRQMEGLLRLPFGHEMPQFKCVIDMPLVARHSKHAPNEILRRLKIDPVDSRQRILMAMRDNAGFDAMAVAARELPEMLILCPGKLPAGVTTSNVIPFQFSDELNFSDVLSVCSASISKLGHGIVTDSIAIGVALLWPPRTGFREDAMVIDMARQNFRQRPIAVEDFLAGRWAGPLRDLLAQPAPLPGPPSDGAEQIAKFLSAQLK